MNYASPKAADFVEVHALNATFLKLLRSPDAPARVTAELPADVAEVLVSLDDEALGHLALAPFLLCSLRELDDDFWDAVHQEGHTPSLFDPDPANGRETAHFISAAIGFIWQMARQNPYTLRLTCCASLRWAERIAEQPLMTLIERATRSDILRLRAENDPRIWRRLLTAARTQDAGVRQTLLNSVLQTLLVASNSSRPRRLKTAACRTDVPAASLVDGH